MKHCGIIYSPKQRNKNTQNQHLTTFSKNIDQHKYSCDLWSSSRLLDSLKDFMSISYKNDPAHCFVQHPMI